MDEIKETESQRCDFKVGADGSDVPATITDDFFEEITTKCAAVSN